VPNPDCPPGAVCEEAEVAAPPAQPKSTRSEAEARVPLPEPEDGGTTVVLPPRKPGTDPGASRWILVQPGQDGQPEQVIVYEDGDAPPHAPGSPVVRKTVREVPQVHHERPTKRLHRHRRWGMNLRLEGVILPQYREDVEDAGMAGLGLSFRYRPIPHFALGLGVDFLGGTDSNGYERQEIPLSLSGLVYFNPRSLAQVYLIAGANWSFARVFSEEPQPNLAEGTDDDYNYFGGHAGLGMEFRVSRLIGLNIDGLALIRSRTDSDEEGRFPEFYDPENGEASNTSVAGMVRGGVTFWW
jgi:hypothetical protein